MADPVSWGMLIVAVVGAAYSGYTAHQTASFNSKMANQEAEYQRQLGDANETRQRRALAKAQGEIGVGAAGAGVSLLSGSILDAFTESQKEGALDAIMIRTGAKNAERNSLIKAEQFDYAGQTALVSSGIDILGAGMKGSKNLSGGSVPDSGKAAGADYDY